MLKYLKDMCSHLFKWYVLMHIKDICAQIYENYYCSHNTEKQTLVILRAVGAIGNENPRRYSSPASSITPSEPKLLTASN